MQKIRLFVITLISVLTAGNICLGVLYFINHAELVRCEKQTVIQQTNGNVLLFAGLFIDKVLLGQGTVSFEDRLSLENAVRSINDKEIFAQWESFTKSQTDNESQTAVGNLLKLLFGKVYQ